MRTAAYALWVSLLFPLVAASQSPSRGEVQQAMKKAVAFFREQAGYKGAYVFRVSSDLSLREGEGAANRGTGWLEPPGTPSVGLAYLEAFELTGEPYLLEAAEETAGALLHGQLVSGGWTESVEWLPEAAQGYAYRSHGGGEKGRNVSTLDDNKTQSALRFLMLLDYHKGFRDERLHEAVVYALDRLLGAQYPNGAWPQKFSDANEGNAPVLAASYPSSWSRIYPNEKYTQHYTLNDNTISDTINTMLLAFDVYGDERFLNSALAGGDFFLLAQLPEPQPAWAQQYDRQMHPVWARKFEPPAVSGGESQGVIRMLLTLYERNGKKEYLAASKLALGYLSNSRRADGRLARFYELHSNRPLYFTKQYELTYSDDDMPTHYGFIVNGDLASLSRRVDELSKAQDDATATKVQPRPPKRKRYDANPQLARKATVAIESLDQRGAWVEPGTMKNYDAPVNQVIESRTFATRLLDLASYHSSLGGQ